MLTPTPEMTACASPSTTLPWDIRIGTTVDRPVWFLASSPELVDSYHMAKIPARVTGGEVRTRLALRNSHGQRVSVPFSPEAEDFLPWITASAHAGPITIENLGAVNILPRGGTGTNSHTAGLLALMMISAGACVWLSVTIDPEISDDFAFRRLARQASGILTLTRYQAGIMQRYDPVGPVVTIPPAFDPTDLPLVPRRSRPIRIGFGGDLWKFEGPDLIMARNPMNMLAERDDVDLHLWGDDVPMAGRYDFGLGSAMISPFINDYMAYLREVRVLDIAVAPLHLHGGDVTDFNRSRWQSHWLEHAVFGTPLVASDLDPYDDFEDGKTILKARTEADWFEALTSLVDNDALRLRIGRAARTHALRHYTTEAVRPRWRDWYAGAREAHPRAQSARRVAL